MESRQFQSCGQISHLSLVGTGTELAEPGLVFLALISSRLATISLFTMASVVSSFLLHSPACYSELGITS
jgi:hypothetical protein